jgi:hypothetical protein
MLKTFLNSSTVSADIAQAPGKLELAKKDSSHPIDCKCKKCRENGTIPDIIKCENQNLNQKENLMLKTFLNNMNESPVGAVGRTGYKDAEAHLSNPEIRRKLKKLIRQAGGKTVITQMLKSFNEMPANESLNEKSDEELLNEYADNMYSLYIHARKILRQIDPKGTDKFKKEFEKAFDTLTDLIDSNYK